MYYLSDINQANFARKKGSKDKKKRQSKINQFFNGKEDPKTGKRNTTLREPLIKNTVRGALVGTGVATVAGGLIATQTLGPYKLAKIAVPNEVKQGLIKVVGNMAVTPIKRGAIGGAVLGTGIYLNRKHQLKQYKEGKHTVQKYQ